MTASRWWRAVGLGATILAGMAAPAPPVGAVGAVGSDDAERAVAAGHYFLDNYVDTDGRVVRHDQGGDTVSEGQAYTMTVAAAIGDEVTFRRVWAWTHAHLLGADGLLASRWADGAVVDPMAAADADLFAAAALVLAGKAFGDDRLGDAARELSAHLFDEETEDVGGRTVLLAGPWAGPTGTVNPSYFVLPAMSILWADGERQWAPVAAASRAVLGELTAEPPHLPPDWASVDPAGRARPANAPSGDSPRYGYDAARALVQLAVDCDPAGRALAAQAWPFLSGESAGAVDAVYDLDGATLSGGEHAVGLVAAAAAAQAAGDGAAADDLLERASDREGERTHLLRCGVDRARAAVARHRPARRLPRLTSPGRCQLPADVAISSSAYCWISSIGYSPEIRRTTVPSPSTNTKVGKLVPP